MFERDLEAYRAVRSRTLLLIENLEQHQLDYSPEAGRWSIGEVVDHVLRAERQYRRIIAELIELERSGHRPLIRRSLRQSDTAPRILPKPLFALAELPLTALTAFTPRGLLEIISRSRLIPFQSSAEATPEPGRDGEELRAELCSSIADTASLLRRSSGLDFRRMVFRDPLLGSNNVPEILRFLGNHEKRHQQQLCEILISDGFPAAVAECVAET